MRIKNSMKKVLITIASILVLVGIAVQASDLIIESKTQNYAEKDSKIKFNGDVKVTIDDLKFNGNNYEEYVNLQSLLENVSACQISDAYNGISRRSGVIPSIKPVNNKKVRGSIYTAETSCDDWGTSALAIDGACEGFMWGGIAAGATFTTVAAKGIQE